MPRHPEAVLGCLKLAALVTNNVRESGRVPGLAMENRVKVSRWIQ
uniref:Uncharacterized protein n=1 Tax=Leclercia adecarboxylata TaxID=83655 RepID=A0A5B8KQR2_9ENTR|nr:Hypothetical protein [Leclercia adecarboxylata]